MLEANFGLKQAKNVSYNNSLFICRKYTFSDLQQVHECFYISCPEHQSKLSFPWIPGNGAFHFCAGEQKGAQI